MTKIKIIVGTGADECQVIKNKKTCNICMREICQPEKDTCYKCFREYHGKFDK
jgi:hypothetical protein